MHQRYAVPVGTLHRAWTHGRDVQHPSWGGSRIVVNGHRLGDLIGSYSEQFMDGERLHTECNERRLDGVTASTDRADR